MKFSKLETIVILLLVVILILSIIYAPKGSYLKDTAENTAVEEVTDPTETTPQKESEQKKESNRPVMEAPLVESDFSFELLSFVATVIDETTEYMIVEPAEGEEERERADRINIVYPTAHMDYLYGIGRRVIIQYTLPMVKQAPYFEIKTDNILTDGYEDFEIITEDSENKTKLLICTAQDIDAFDSFDDSIDEDLYYYGLSEVNVAVNGETMCFTDALAKGYITLDGVIAKCNKDVSNGICEEVSYDDGGSSVYKYNGFNIIKYHTLDGNRDVYIGSSDMDINICNVETSMPVITSQPSIPYEDDWGLTLNVEDALNGVTYYFTQSGGNPTGELMYGSDYTVEKLVDGKWITVDYIVEGDVTWTSEAYFIPMNSTTEKKTISFEYLYGELTNGVYRFGKSVMDFRQTGNFDTKMYYAEFDIN